jgi:hypothetical protein
MGAETTLRTPKGRLWQFLEVVISMIVAPATDLCRETGRLEGWKAEEVT